MNGQNSSGASHGFGATDPNYFDSDNDSDNDSDDDSDDDGFHDGAETNTSIFLSYDYNIHPGDTGTDPNIPDSDKDGLLDVLLEVPDMRANKRSLPCSSFLLLVAMGLLAGRFTLASIQRYGQFFTQNQRAWLGWPSNRVGTFRPAPSYTALCNLLCKMGSHAFVAALNGWLTAPRGTLSRGLSIGGKYVRYSVKMPRKADAKPPAKPPRTTAAPTPPCPPPHLPTENQSNKRAMPSKYFQNHHRTPARDSAQPPTDSFFSRQAHFPIAIGGGRR